MQEAREIELRSVADRVGGLDLVVISPNDPAAMVRHTEECRELGFPFAADPSQQLARLDGPDVRRLVDGAAYLFTNEYETSLLQRSTGWTREEVLNRVGCWVTTHGGDGVRIATTDGSISVAAVATTEVDPTGIGDAFRAGFLWGRQARLSLSRSAQAGCALAAIVLESVGTQEYAVDRGTFSDRVAKGYDNDAAAEIESKLRI